MTNTTPKPIVWAFDLATKMGVAEGTVGELPRCYTVDCSVQGGDFADTFGKFTAWLIDRLAVSRPTHVILEAPLSAGALMNRAQRGFGGAVSNSQTFRVLYGLPAIATGIFYRAGVHRVKEQGIQGVRKTFIGHGNLPKDEAKGLVLARCHEMGLDPQDDNASDAAALWFHHANEIEPSLAQTVCPPLGGRYVPRSGD